MCFTGAMQPNGGALLRAVLRALGELAHSGFGTRPADPPALLRHEQPVVGPRPLRGDAGRARARRRTSCPRLPQRVPYLQAMAVLRSCDIVLVMGSADQYYHASKLYPAIVSGRPILAICHARVEHPHGDGRDRRRHLRHVPRRRGAGAADRRDSRGHRDAGDARPRGRRIAAKVERFTARASTAVLARILDAWPADRSLRRRCERCRNRSASASIGLGHWGPNHVRIFSQCAGVRVVAAADLSADRRRHVGQLYRDVELVADAKDVFNRADVDAVVIATPAKTHFAITRAALEAGKHVLLEKPMCTSLADARALLGIAAASDRVAGARPRLRLQRRHPVPARRHRERQLRRGCNTSTRRARISGRSAAT